MENRMLATDRSTGSMYNCSTSLWNQEELLCSSVTTLLSNKEVARLEFLRQYQILDTEPEKAFDDLTYLAAHICGTPIALVSLSDASRQWFKSKVGLDATEAPRQVAFCDHAIKQSDVFIVPDTLSDPRFATNPLVISDPRLRFYAGAPLITTEGYALGTLCVLDLIPRKLSAQQVEALRVLSCQVTAQLELRRNLVKLGAANVALQDSEERFRLLVDGVKDYAIFMLAPNRCVISWNTGAEQIKGYQASEIIGQNFSCFYTDADIEVGLPSQALRVACAEGRWENEGWRVRKDGSRFWANVVITALHDRAGVLRGFSKVMRDITERKQAESVQLRAKVTEAAKVKLEKEINERKLAESKLVYYAFHDALTGLPNRALLMDRLEHMLSRAKGREDCLFAVLFLDLDRFKVLNDSLGHMVGDQLLMASAKRLSACLGPGDTVARLGGDEFAILLTDIKEISDATQIASRIQQELTLPFNLAGHEVFTTVSIGIAPSTLGYDLPQDMLRDADTAMYRAKTQGKARYKVFNQPMHAMALTRLQLENDLRRALERQEFQLHYQPIVSLRTGLLSGFEALVRWQHPIRGIISPGEFIPIAEETGLIVPLGYWVLHSACRQMRAWQRQFPAEEPLTISVNLSGKQFLQPDLVEQIGQVLLETSLDARSLKLEITESVIMENTQSATSTLQQLKALGVQLHMDDFGTGYSSLSYLRRFPIDTLKIDRSFVSHMGVSDEDLEIVQTIVTLAHNLGMTVTAEGIETAEQLALLRAIKCEFGQGYFFDRPLDCAEAWLLMANCYLERFI